MTAEQMFRRLRFTEKTTSNIFIMYECVNITTSRVIVVEGCTWQKVIENEERKKELERLGYVKKIQN